MRIINSIDSITIGLMSFPKNSIIATKANSNNIQIAVIGNPLQPVIVKPWDEFTNETGGKYSDIDEVIADLIRGHNGNLQGNDQIKIDSVSELVTYIGYSKPGTAVNKPFWAVLRITSSASSAPSTTDFAWATGFKDRTNVWSDRLTLTYVS